MNPNKKFLLHQTIILLHFFILHTIFSNLPTIIPFLFYKIDNLFWLHLKRFSVDC